MMKVEKVIMNKVNLSIHSGAFYFGGQMIKTIVFIVGVWLGWLLKVLRKDKEMMK